MKKDYVACKDNNNRTGTSPKRCRLYDEFDEMYGCRPSTKSECTFSSVSTSTESEIDSEQDEKSKPANARRKNEPFQTIY